MTRHEHMLLMLGDACSGVCQRAEKAVRFGMQERQKDHALNNGQRIVWQYVDVLALMEMLQEEEHLEVPYLRPAIEVKKAHVERMLGYAAHRGRLEPQGGTGEAGPEGAAAHLCDLQQRVVQLLPAQRLALVVRAAAAAGMKVSFLAHQVRAVEGAAPWEPLKDTETAMRVALAVGLVIDTRQPEHILVSHDEIEQPVQMAIKGADRESALREAIVRAVALLQLARENALLAYRRIA